MIILSFQFQLVSRYSHYQLLPSAAEYTALVTGYQEPVSELIFREKNWYCVSKAAYYG